MVHLSLSAVIKAPLRGASASRYWSFNRRGTRRASVAGKPRASRSLRHRSIVGRRRTEDSALATRAARCSLRSHSPLLPWRRSYRYNLALAGVARDQYRIDRVSLRSTRGRSLVPSYGRYRLWSTSRWQISLPNELARSARFVRSNPFRQSKRMCAPLPNRRGRYFRPSWGM